MKEKMTRILDHMHRYNSDQMAMLAFGLDSSVEYDALVVAPSFTPWKLKMDEYCTVTTLKEGSYIADKIKLAERQCHIVDSFSRIGHCCCRDQIEIDQQGRPENNNNGAAAEIILDNRHMVTDP